MNADEARRKTERSREKRVVAELHEWLEDAIEEQAGRGHSKLEIDIPGIGSEYLEAVRGTLADRGFQVEPLQDHGLLVVSW